jgi:hypothetical protein
MEKDNTLKNVLIIGAVVGGGYLLYKFFKGGAASGAVELVGGAGSAIEGTGAVAGGIISGVGQDLQTLGEVAKKAAPLIERMSGIEPIRSIREMQKTPIAISPVGDIVTFMSPLGIGGLSGVNIDFIGPISRFVKKIFPKKTLPIAENYYPQLGEKGGPQIPKNIPANILASFKSDVYIGPKSTGPDSTGPNKVATTKTQTNSIVPATKAKVSFPKMAISIIKAAKAIKKK